MARYIRSPRFPVVNSARFYSAMPSFRHVVAPGETLKKLRFMYKVQSLPLHHATSGAYLDTWFFYVPMRAVWNHWPAYIMSHGSAPTIPKAGPNRQANFFEAAHSKPRLYSMAYIAVINRYFRASTHEMINPTTLTPVVVNNEYEMAGLPNVDFTVENMFTPAGHDLDRTVEVVNNEFSIRELQDESALLRHEQRMADNTDHYADYLRLFGVNAKPNMIVEPEPLGHNRKFIQPSRLPNDQTGLTVQSYFVEGDFTLTKPRFFPEHGYIVGITAIRPKFYLSGHGAFESLWDNPQEWPLKSKPDLLDQQYTDWGAVNVPTDAQYTSDAFLAHGQQLVGSHGVLAGVPRPENPNYFVPGPLGSKLLRYPDPMRVSSDMVDWGDADKRGGWYGPTGRRHCYQLDGIVSLSIATPLRLNVPPMQEAPAQPAPQTSTGD